MKNGIFKLSTLLVAGVIISAPTLAEDKMSVHGQVRLSVDHDSNGTELKSNASRVGFSGALDTHLDDTQIIYMVDLQGNIVGPDDAAVKFRDAYAGLKSGTYGTVHLGRIDTGYKTSYTKIEPWTDNALQMRQGGTHGVSDLHSNYFNNAVSYTSPNFNGISVNGHYSMLSDTSNARLHNAGKLKDFLGGKASGLGIKYDSNGLRLTADTLTISSKNNPGSTDPTKAKNGTATLLTAQYKMDSGMTLAAGYEDVANLNLGKNMFAIVSQKIGQYGLVTAGYGVNQSDANSVYSTTDGASSLDLGAKYLLNKKSEVFAGYNKFSRGATDVSTVTVGMNVKFGY